MGRGAARGFTLVETLIAVAIGVVLGYFILLAITSLLHSASLTAQREHEQAAIASLVDRWQAEEDSAWAIFTPPNDVLGSPNTDGHELDFFTRDGKNRTYFWAYTYDARSQTLARYLYGSPGTTPMLDRRFSGITKFVAHTYPVTALQDPNSAIYSALYANASLQAGAVQFYPSMPWIAGGNQITDVQISGASFHRDMQLSTQTAPSGFTVVLRYTPAPTPTPAASSTPSPTLAVWPPFVELPMQGQSLQTAALAPRRNIAYYLNLFLGGSIANAGLAPCAINQARAFTDGSFTTPLVNATPPPGALPVDVNGNTDAGGCIRINDSIGSDVYLYEPGNTTPLQQYGDNCGAAVTIVSENPPSYTGTNVGLKTQGGSSPMQSCSMIWEDGRSTPSRATVSYEVSGCVSTAAYTYMLVGIGGSCTSSDPNNYAANSTPPDCTPAGSGGIQYTDLGLKSTSGPGSAVDNGDFTVTVSRTGIGTITVTIGISELLCAGTNRTKIVYASESYTFND
jgi:prepilin-type N-terminal cleavage/methylation domain-containing protein